MKTQPVLSLRTRSAAVGKNTMPHYLQANLKKYQVPIKSVKNVKVVK
jgi:hypothetical protein